MWPQVFLFSYMPYTPKVIGVGGADFSYRLDVVGVATGFFVFIQAIHTEGHGCGCGPIFLTHWTS